MKEISVNQIDKNTFDLISKDWMLIGAKVNGKANAMTASWGGMGFMWNKNVAFIFIRPQRYTKTLIDNTDTLSLSFFDGQKDMLTYMGKVSGKNKDKIAECGLKLEDYNEPVFENASMTMICKKLYAQELNKDGFFDKSFINQFYPEGDYHCMYVVEIQKVLVK